jgi:predicted small lipoprotein YifL
MKKSLSMLATIAILFLVAGCGNKTSSETTEAKQAENATPPTGEGHVDVASVVPGSYEDWCDEHQVPETQCTRCDPSLVPAFKAAGDWDEQHGLPMSQCSIHNPNLKIVRPPKPEGQ